MSYCFLFVFELADVAEFAGELLTPCLAEAFATIGVSASRVGSLRRKTITRLREQFGIAG